MGGLLYSLLILIIKLNKLSRVLSKIIVVLNIINDSCKN